VFGFKSFKKYWATCRDLQVYFYKTREDAGRDPVYHLPLKGEISMITAIFSMNCPSEHSSVPTMIRLMNFIC
jgi:hypothetical protein